MAGFDFEVGLQVALFLTVVWATGRLFAILKMPPLLGWLAAGIVLGPRLFDMVPYASNGRCDHIIPGLLPYSVPDAPPAYDAAKNHSAADSGRRRLAGPAGCDDVPWERWEYGKTIFNVWVFVGHLGVTLMIMESGMHIHFEKVAALGKLATYVAIVGTGFPIVAGTVVVGALWTGSNSNYAFYPWGFAAGCAFAPTSVGISINLLDESKMLNSDAGQTTLTAAFIDDVFSLVTLVILRRLALGPPKVQDIIVPLVCSFALLGISVLLAIKVLPFWVPKLLERIPIKKNVSIQPRDEAHLLLMFMTLFGLGWVSSVEEIGGVPFIGSHLLGAFGAGMCWVNVPRSHAIWAMQLKRIVRWMMRVFFAATVGFAVPVDVMFTLSAFWRGLVLGAGPCIATKLISGICARVPYKDEDAKRLAAQASWATKWLQPQQLLVGIAMVARGEFAYLVAESMQATRYQGAPEGEEVFMLSDEVYAAVVWALIWATITSPIMFNWAIAVFDRATPMHRSRYIGGERKEFASRAFVIHIAAKYTPGVQRQVFNTLHASGVDVLEARLSSVRADDSPAAEITAFIDHFTVLARGQKKDFDDEKLEEMQHHLSEALNDENAQIIFEPVDEDFSKDGIIEVQILGEHHPAVLHEITDALDTMGLDVIKAAVHHSQQPVHHHAHALENSHKRGSKSNLMASAHAPDAAGHVIDVAPAPSPATAHTLARQMSGALKRPIVYRLGKRRSKKSNGVVTSRDSRGDVTSRNSRGDTSTHDGRAAPHQDHQVGRETFYARESDGSHTTSAKRRHNITLALRKVLEEHHLHGEVLVRLLHESEMALAHTVPKLDEIKDKVAVVRCVGAHQKALLHEICEYVQKANCDVLHADMDTTLEDIDVNVFYISRTDSKPMQKDEMRDMQAGILALYSSHHVEGKVTVESGAQLSTPPVSPNVTPTSSGREHHPRRGSRAFHWSRAGFGTELIPNSPSLPPAVTSVSSSAVGVDVGAVSSVPEEASP